MCFIQLSFNLYIKLSEHRSCKSLKNLWVDLSLRENKIRIGQSFKRSRVCGSHVSLIFRNSCFWTSEISGTETRHKMDGKRKEQKRGKHWYAAVVSTRIVINWMKWIAKGWKGCTKPLEDSSGRLRSRKHCDKQIRIKSFFFWYLSAD
jgi:hypothetical protein